MKQLLYLIAVLTFSFSTVNSHAQLNHFIYLQSENKQPFYVKMDKKILNSTIAGYLIIPKLQDGTHDFSLGFLSADNKEHDFSCLVSKDAGYLVKNFGDKGWGLFNLQTLQVLMAGAKEQDVAKENKTDAFSNLLSDVVNDPTIKQENKTLAVSKETKTDLPVSPEVNKTVQQSVAIVAVDSIKSDREKVKDVSGAGNSIFLSTVIKKETIKTEDGLRITYVDLVNGTQDTISILIPRENQDEQRDSVKANLNLEKGVSEAKKVKTDTSKKSAEENKATDSVERISQDSISSNKPALSANTTESSKEKEDKKFLDIDLANPVTASLDNNVVKKDTSNFSIGGTDVPLMINSNCKVSASDEDFLKLRKKMASAKSEDDMISNARKVFKQQKCFTTDQIKNLGVLFLKDADRYSFFDAAYPFVSDSRNYKLLEDQLTDNYYKLRFQAMIRH
jgi:hypothetical protein